MVWAASEGRDGELAMEERNTIKLAMTLARQRRWRDILVQALNVKVNPEATKEEFK